MSFSNRLLTFFAVSIFCLTSMAAIGWSAEPQRSRGQTIYVPAYSHVFTGPRANPYNLAITLTLRNTDPRDGMVVTAIDYHDHNGRLIAATPPPLLVWHRWPPAMSTLKRKIPVAVLPPSLLCVGSLNARSARRSLKQS